MGFSFRKTFQLFPGLRLSLSKTGPRLSVGVPGIRANVGLDGRTQINGSAGPIRYRKTIASGTRSSDNTFSIGSFLRSLFR